MTSLTYSVKFYPGGWRGPDGAMVRRGYRAEVVGGLSEGVTIATDLEPTDEAAVEALKTLARAAIGSGTLKRLSH